uniref:Putative secreted protein n=1 Tax=Ixodes ricinus TaxID=34613 RepID=A0A6B0URG1_IXORI
MLSASTFSSTMSCTSCSGWLAASSTFTSAQGSWSGLVPATSLTKSSMLRSPAGPSSLKNPGSGRLDLSTGLSSSTELCAESLRSPASFVSLVKHCTGWSSYFSYSTSLAESCDASSRCSNSLELLQASSST